MRYWTCDDGDEGDDGDDDDDGDEGEDDDEDEGASDTLASQPKDTELKGRDERKE